jgi:hypothetical protein
MWREGLGAYKIVTGEVDGGSYKNHPATKEFRYAPQYLWMRLKMVREEMLKRGYHPKELPAYDFTACTPDPWQTLEEQIKIIRSKNCKCKI